MAVGGGGGGGGGTGGMRFQLVLDTVANSAGVDKLISQFKKLEDKLKSFQSGWGNAVKNYEKNFASAQAQGYYVAATLERAGQKSLWFSKVFTAATVGSFTTLMHEAANLEQYIIRLQSTQGTTKKDALDIFNTTLRATTHLPVTEEQLVRVATTFKQRGMDIREAFGGKTYQDVIKSGHAVEGLADSMTTIGKQGVGLLDIFSDLATTQGQLGSEDIGKFVREFSEFMATGQTRFLRTRLDPALLHELNMTKGNSAKAMQTIYEYLEKRNAIGVSRLAMQTFSGVMTNFKGLPQRIANAVFQPGIATGLARKFALSLSAAFEKINEYFDETTEKGQKFLAELRRVFEFIGTVAIAAVNGLTKAFTMFADFMSNNPAFGVFLTMVMGILSGLLALKGVFFLLRGSMLTFALAAKAMSAIAGVLNLSMALMAGKFLLVTAVGGLLFAMFRKVAMVIGAVFEAMQSYDPETGLAKIGTKTYDDLQQSGLIDLFKGFLGIVVKISNLFSSKLSLEEAFPTLAKVKHFVDDLTSAFTHLISQVFGIRPSADDAENSLDGFENSADTTAVKIREAADAAGKVANVLARDIPAGVAFAMESLGYFIVVIDLTIRGILRLIQVLAGGMALLGAFTGNMVMVGAGVAGFAGAAYLDSKYTDSINREEASGLGLPQAAMDLITRSEDIQAGRREHDDYSTSGKKYPKSSDLAKTDTVYDPARGTLFSVPTHGVRMQDGVPIASFVNNDKYFQSQNAAGIPIKSNVKVQNNVYLDGKQIMSSIQERAASERARAGSNALTPPMASTPAQGVEDEQAAVSRAF